MQRLILSVFPGIDLLGLGFQREMPDACIVRGPDLIFGSLHDVRTFHPPAGPWTGIIGGPPCQCFSRLRHLNPLAGSKHGNMIPELERVVEEAQPIWFLMENVPEAPVPQVRGYWAARSLLLNNRWLGAEQQRVRRFSFGVRQDCAPRGIDLDVGPDLAVFEAPLVALAVTGSEREVPVKLGGSGLLKRRLRPPTVLAGHGDGPGNRDRGLTAVPIARACELQGLPPDYLDDTPFTEHGKRRLIGNGVPLFMARVIARAVNRAMEGISCTPCNT